ncbi:solute carrier organic anion transporter family member 1A2-like [Glandiceps talaboti]
MDDVVVVVLAQRYQGGLANNKFNLSATQQGFIVSTANIGTLCTIPFVSFFIGKPSNHRPRWICFGFLLFSIGYIFLILPQFVSQRYTFDKAGNFSSGAGSLSRGLCGSNITKDCSDHQSTEGEDNAFAYRLFLTGKVLEGIAYGFIFPLCFSYVDDFAGKRSAIYLGLIDSAAGLGIPLGFGVISPATLTLYVDFNRVDMSDINIDDSDPRWVGAWWLPIAICIPILVILAFPLLLFPKYLPTSDIDTAEKGESSERRREQWHIHNVRDFLRSVCAILKNPGFMLTALVYTLNAPIGFVLFMPRYFQKDLGFTASMGNMIMGFLWLFPNFPTGLVNGILIKKLKLGMLGLTKLVLVIIAVIIISNTLVIALPCEGPYVEGTKSGQTMDLQCTDCHCSVEHYQPVCGSDGLNYYSPCYAGCETAVSDKRRENTSNNIDDSSSLKGKEDGGNGVQLKAIKNFDHGNPAYEPE